MTLLEQLYNHPQNNLNDTYLAAFVSADKTYPIFVRRVIASEAGKYRADCVGYKWGYDTTDVMFFTWYSDEQIKRETSERLYSTEQINSYRWRPAERALKMPYPIESKLALAELKPFIAYANDLSIYVVVALDKDHVRQQLVANEQLQIEALDLNKPSVQLLSI